VTSLEIRYFLEIVNQGVSFTKASQALYVSQPALTKHINTLGKELGVRLIDTSNKSAPELTQEGKLFYQLFTEWQEGFNKTLYEVKALGSNSLRLASLTGWDLETLMPITKIFARTYPDIDISFTTCGFNTLKNGLLNNQYDLVIAMSDFFRGLPNISIHECYHGLCYLIFSSFHPLARKADDGKLSISDFKDDIFYILSEEEAAIILQSCVTYCKSKGFVPHFKQLPDLDTIIINLQMHGGYTIMDELIYAKDHLKLKRIPLDLTFTGSLAWKTNNTNKALQLFLETSVLNKEYFRR
jgi:DNA-binding transcriptional LysR family regulator